MNLIHGRLRSYYDRQRRVQPGASTLANGRVEKPKENSWRLRTRPAAHRSRKDQAVDISEHACQKTGPVEPVERPDDSLLELDARSGALLHSEIAWQENHAKLTWAEGPADPLKAWRRDQENPVHGPPGAEARKRRKGEPGQSFPAQAAGAAGGSYHDVPWRIPYTT